MANLRWQSFAGVEKYIRSTYGEDGFRKIVDALDPEDRDVVMSKDQTLPWYPARAFINLIRAVDKIYGKGDNALCREIGKFSANESFTGIYRVFIQFANPRFVINRAALVWRMVYDSGNADVSYLNDKTVIFKVRDFDSPDKALCKEIEGYLEKVIGMSGVRDALVTEKKCRCSKDEYCEYEIKWQ
ncbi:MAG: DUF2378 family protein [Candidatus Omnitrophota bacterium]|nr:DUF2378 family protein [Candidatus Omnitrophota bacterium]MDD5654873.1 DUF2378 family protein [Candidatus Omnitrophota bacterium]